MIDRIKHEPVLTLAFVQALLVAAVALGFDLTGEQVAALTAVAAAAIGLIARKKVTPVSSGVLG